MHSSTHLGKLVITTLFATNFLSTPILASEPSVHLCDHRQKIIEPDMQMAEELFTQEVYDNALKALKTLDAKSEDTEIQFAIENTKKVVVGYPLRAKALATGDKADIEKFCDFLVEEAFYHD
jgi:hypothetical protein